MKHKLLPTILTLALALTPLTGLAQSPAPETSFYIEPSFHAEGKSRAEATLKNVSDQAYFYVEDDLLDSLDTIQQIELTKSLVFLGDEFDKNIYSKLRALYGAEWNSQPKVTVFIANITPGTAAFVDPGDLLSSSENPASNERAMIYMGSSVVFSELAKHHLAHEFVHLIENNQKERLNGVQEEKWLSEALAEYAPTYLGYNDTYKDSYLQSRVDNFITNPSTPLAAWDGTSADFGASSLFAHYLAGHYGEEFLRDLMRSGETGRRNITQALQERGHSETFSEVYTRWTVANYINTSALDANGENDAKYAYAGSGLSIANLRVPNTAEFSVFPDSQTGISLMLPGGGAHWVRFVPGSLDGSSGGELELDFTPTDRFEGDLPLAYVTTDITGKAQVHSVAQTGSTTSISIPNFGTDILSLVVVPSNMRGPDASPLPDAAVYSLSLSLDSNSSGEVKGETDYADGALLRAEGDTKVYVIKKTPCQSEASCVGWKRWIPTAEIFEQYGHLRWQDIIDVPASELDKYTESRLIKFTGDYRVYEVDYETCQSEASCVGWKQWLDITPAAFESSGRNWNAVFEVNQKEYNYYSTGSPKNS